MTYTVNSPIVHAPTGTLAEALAWLDVKAGPETEYATELWRLCTLVQIDPVLLFSQAAHETADFSSAWWLNRRNPAGIGITGDPEQNADSQIWKNGADAARAHAVHMVAYIDEAGIDWHRFVATFRQFDQRYDAVWDAGYGGTVNTLADLTGKWATDPRYAEKIAAKANVIFPARQEQKPVTASVTIYPVAGLPGPGIALPVPLIQQIIPRGQVNQRPGIKRELPGYWVQHETANTAPGADAAMHSRWLNNGAGGATLSFHFAVDDGVIYQMIPIDEVTWQAADGAGPGNMSGISCELCVNKGIDTDKARHNAEALCAGIFKQLGLNVDRVKAHYDFNEGVIDRHHCPDTMLNDGYWPVTFKANFAALLRDAGKPEYATPLPVPFKEGDIGWKQMNGTPVFLLEAEVEVVRATSPRAWADGDNSDGDIAPVSGPRLKQGERVKVIGSFANKNAKGKTVRWLIRASDNARISGSACRPLLPVTQ